MALSTSKLTTAARLLLGAVFTVFGLNGFLHFIPVPHPEGNALAFMGGLAASGYFFPLLKATEIITGVLLLSGRLVPLALTVLAPIVLNIVLYHALLAPAGLALPVLVLALELYLAWSYRDAFRPMLAWRHGGSLDGRSTSALPRSTATAS